MALLIETTDAPSDATTPYTIAPGDTFQGVTLMEGGRDWVAVELTAGAVYRFEVLLADRDPGVRGLAYAQLALYDADSTLQTRNHPAFFTPDWQSDWPDFGYAEAEFSIATSGTYFIEVGGHTFGDFGEYDLVLTEVPTEAEDLPADATTSAMITPDQTFLGSVEAPGDADWVAVTLERGKLYEITVHSPPTVGALYDPAMAVYDTAQTLVAANDDAPFADLPFAAQVVVNPKVTETFYIAAQGSDDLPNVTGQYRISIQEETRTGTSGHDLYIHPADNPNGSVFGGQRGFDTIIGGGNTDRLSGDNGWDSIEGMGGDDFLWGDRGRDTLRGGAGNDEIRGGFGGDMIFGGAGDDTLYTGAGWDTITGGAGADLFVMRGLQGENVVTDFDPTEDTLDIVGMLERLGPNPEQALTIFATVDDGDTVMTFKSGVRVVIEGITDFDALAEAIYTGLG